MAQTILLPNEFDIDNVNFLPPRKNNMGGQNVLVTYATGESRPGPLVFQTPRLRLPFGLDRQEPDNGGPVKYNVNASLAHGDNPPNALKIFTENIRGLDDFIRDKGVTLSESWFNKPMKKEVIDELYKSCEKHPKDPKWASTIKLKLPVRDDKPQFESYDDKKNKISLFDEDGKLNLECFQKGTEIVALIQCTGVWFMGKTQFGIGWKILQVKVYQTNKLVGYSIVDEEDPKEEEETSDPE